MQIIENVSRIDGSIVERRPSTEQLDWDDLTVILKHADKVDDRAELLHERLDTEVVIGVPRDLLGDAKAGDNVEGHVSVVGPGKIFASPQSVEGGRFAVLPAEG
jgi:hypothetical protein